MGNHARLFRSFERKKTNGSVASTSKRDESLSFLLQTSVLKISSTSSVQQLSTNTRSGSPIPDVRSHTQQPSEHMPTIDTQSVAGSYVDSCFEYSLSPGSPDSPLSPRSQTSLSKKRKTSQIMETNEILREFLNTRPKPSDFMPQKPADDVQKFFDSMASTVRNLSSLAIARIKLKIGQIIGEEEISWAQNAPCENVEYIYTHPTQRIKNKR